MKKNSIILSLSFVFILLFNTSCEEQTDKTGLLTGFWTQVSISEDGEEMQTPALSLLIEPNGVYRTYAKDADTKEHYGVWTITDDTWLELTADIWRVINNPVAQSTAGNQWAKNHIPTRFTILSLSESILEIRLKTYVGYKKYSALFTEGVRPLITVDNLDEINDEFKVQKTYIYTFIKK
ncbi:MAG: hypothetical protein LBG77_05215 [Dysgonamonadaceae bacterium]|jgi:hypothetical protein|nr:hypothetical protein [Dysgonamonadaceae bacterium]